MRVLKVPRGFGWIKGCLEGSRIILEGLIGSWRFWYFVEKIWDVPGRTWRVQDDSQKIKEGQGGHWGY